MTESVAVVRVRLDFAYDGTDFSGWAAQPGLRTVEGTLGEALARVVRVDPAARLVVAGRTDAGVHARAQVAHADLPASAWRRLPGRSSRSPEQSLADRLNSLLPGDIVVHRVAAAPPGFDARFAASERRYAYRVADATGPRNPLARRHQLWHPRELDLVALNAASGILTGLRDFAAFCRPKPGGTTIRDLVEFSWMRPADGEDRGLFVATVRADAFCHSMVRSIVGAVLAVGDGRRDLDWLAAVAASPRRTSAVSVAPAHGLALEEVVYPRDADLAARAEATRGRRTLD